MDFQLDALHRFRKSKTCQILLEKKFRGSIPSYLRETPSLHHGRDLDYRVVPRPLTRESLERFEHCEAGPIELRNVVPRILAHFVTKQAQCVGTLSHRLAIDVRTQESQERVLAHRDAHDIPAHRDAHDIPARERLALIGLAELPIHLFEPPATRLAKLRNHRRLRPRLCRQGSSAVRMMVLKLQWVHTKWK